MSEGMVISPQCPGVPTSSLDGVKEDGTDGDDIRSDLLTVS